jgi:inosine-uridine nucleoside N-ribohydrolase
MVDTYNAAEFSRYPARGRTMPRKVILVADPGIDTAFAIALALHDPNLDIIGLLPCAGNVSAQQATVNVSILIDHLDPVRWPRTAAALPIEYEIDATVLHGVDGLGNCHFPASTRHQLHPADKVLVELIREHPRDVTVICLGPATTVARALDRDPEVSTLIDKLVLVGGSWKEPGNVGPAAEYHFYLDPDAVKRCLHVGLHPLLIPLDVTRRLILSPSELLELPNPESKTSQFLRKIVPFGIRASSNMYGIEGFHLKDVLGVAAVALPGCVMAESRIADIETKGELTRGMLVVDARKRPVGLPNAQIGVEAAIGEIRQYIDRVLKLAV